MTSSNQQSGCASCWENQRPGWYNHTIEQCIGEEELRLKDAYMQCKRRKKRQERKWRRQFNAHCMPDEQNQQVSTSSHVPAPARVATTEIKPVRQYKYDLAYRPELEMTGVGFQPMSQPDSNFDRWVYGLGPWGKGYYTINVMNYFCRYEGQGQKYYLFRPIGERKPVGQSSGRLDSKPVNRPPSKHSK